MKIEMELKNSQAQSPELKIKTSFNVRDKIQTHPD